MVDDLFENINEEENYAEPLESIPGYKNDEKILQEAGIDIDLEENYDLTTRKGRENLAKDLHNKYGTEIKQIADASSKPRTITTRPKLGQLRYEVIKDPVANEIEKEIYQNLSAVAAYQRTIDEENLTEAFATAVVQYHDNIDRFEESYQQAVENLSDEENLYEDEELVEVSKDDIEELFEDEDTEILHFENKTER